MVDIGFVVVVVVVVVVSFAVGVTCGVVFGVAVTVAVAVAVTVDVAAGEVADVPLWVLLSMYKERMGAAFCFCPFMLSIERRRKEERKKGRLVTGHWYGFIIKRAALYEV